MAVGVLPEAVSGNFPAKDSGGIHAVLSGIFVLGVGILLMLPALSGAHGQGDAVSSDYFLPAYGFFGADLSGAVCGLSVGSASAFFGRI